MPRDALGSSAHREVVFGEGASFWRLQAVTALAFSDDGAVLLSGGEDTVACAWLLSDVLDASAAQQGGLQGPPSLHTWCARLAKIWPSFLVASIGDCLHASCVHQERARGDMVLCAAGEAASCDGGRRQQGFSTVLDEVMRRESLPLRAGRSTRCQSPRCALAWAPTLWWPLPPWTAPASCGASRRVWALLVCFLGSACCPAKGLPHSKNNARRISVLCPGMQARCCAR
jgi:hypothetical protein